MSPLEVLFDWVILLGIVVVLAVVVAPKIWDELVNGVSPPSIHDPYLSDDESWGSTFEDYFGHEIPSIGPKGHSNSPPGA